MLLKLNKTFIGILVAKRQRRRPWPERASISRLISCCLLTVYLIMQEKSTLSEYQKIFFFLQSLNSFPFSLFEKLTFCNFHNKYCK